VRGRIDLKYALSLDLEDAGFDFSVLCEFRARLLAGGRDQSLLEVMLERLRERGLVKASSAPTPPTFWRRSAPSTTWNWSARRCGPRSTPDRRPSGWPGRTGRTGRSARVEQYRLPKGEAARQALGEAMGADGHDLLAALFAETQRFWLCRLPRGCGSSGSSNSATTKIGCAGVCQSTSQPTPSLAL
jgi:transposase